MLPKVTIQQLEYLEAVTTADTWAEAAATVGVSASALSQGLAELEKRIGLPLFAWRGRQRIIDTDAVPVVDYCRRVLADTRDLSDWIERRHAGEVGQLRLGMIDVGAVHHYPDQLAEFRHSHPEVSLTLAVAPSAPLLSRVVDGDLDLAIVVQPDDEMVERHDLVVVELLDEPLAVYAPAGVPVGKPDTWGPWVTFPEDSLTRQTIAAELQRRGAPFEVVAESNQPDVIREMVNLSIGWTVLPEVQAERGERPLRRALKDQFANRRLVAVRRSTSSNPLIDELLGVLTSS